MKTRDVDPRARARERDQPPTENDRYARESFTWRRMEPWQIWILAVVAVIIAVLGLIWVY